jgi:hypothetical protein
VKATNGDGTGGDPRPVTVPARERTGVPGAASVPEGADDLVMVLLPRAAWDATAALGRRLGAATGGEPIPPAAVMGMALRRLQEDTDRRLGPG